MIQDDIAVKVDSLSKTFKLPHEKSSGIKQKLVHIGKKKNSGYELQKALSDVDFDIKKGEFFGIVGRNGSGKSTLLKMLAGIYTPDKGAVTVNGSLTPFIELGVGFNPELTGRENVFLNGALLGFSRQEMLDKYDDIVEFSELERFMDQKLKNYSSGMQVRLAFSIAIQAKSDILLLDEVLAVGDEAFQRKSLGVFERYKANGQTIILVTHDMAVVEKFCTRALMLDSGKVVKIGKPSKVAELYSATNEENYLSLKQTQEDLIKKRAKNAVQFKLYNESNEETNKFYHGDKVTVEITWKNDEIRNIGLALLKQSGEYIFGTNTINDSFKLKNNKIAYTLNLDIGAGDYNFIIGLFGEEEADAIDFIQDGPTFIVKQRKSETWQGLTNLSHDWR